VGGRSRAAAKILEGKGFNTVYNLAGGIKAWQGQTAAGPAEMGMALLRGDETSDEIIVLAYGLENGLAQFYAHLGGSADDPNLRDLFTRLTGIEEKHRDGLYDLHISRHPDGQDKATFEEDTVSTTMEGGFTTEEFLEENRAALGTAAGILNTAMALEAQGLDLYVRYAQESRDNDVKEILRHLADEEKAHLTSLGRLLEGQDVSKW